MPKQTFTIKTRPDGSRYTRVRIGGGEPTIIPRADEARVFTDKEVRTAVATAQADAARGTYIDPRDAKITFKEFAEDWRASHPCAWTTGELIRNSLERHWYPLLGDVPLSKLRRSMIQSAIADLSGRLAPITIREQTFPHLRQPLRAAVADRIIPADPSEGVRLPKVVRTEVRIPTLDQVQRLAEVIDPRYRALVAVGAGLGLRQGEVFGLSIDRVRLRDVKIDRQLKRGPNGSHLGSLKTERSYRTVPLPQWVAHELGEHLERYPNDDPEGLVFVAPAGGRLRRDQWNRRVFKPAAEAVGAEWLTFHGLRHFYASALIRAGHSPTSVAKRLGNTAKMVLETYAHLWPDDDDRTRQAIDELFGRSASQEVTG